MTLITSCPHGMGYPAACIDCLADGPCALSNGTTTTVPEAERWMDARTDSTCPGCRDRIEAGDEIGLTEGRWYCAGCVT